MAQPEPQPLNESLYCWLLENKQLQAVKDALCSFEDMPALSEFVLSLTIGRELWEKANTTSLATASFSLAQTCQARGLLVVLELAAKAYQSRGGNDAVRRLACLFGIDVPSLPTVVTGMVPAKVDAEIVEIDVPPLPTVVTRGSRYLKRWLAGSVVFNGV